MPARRPRRAKPHQPLTPAELDEMSHITMSDVAHAAGAWDQDAPLPFRRLLDAREVKPERPRRRGSADSGA